MGEFCRKQSHAEASPARTHRPRRIHASPFRHRAWRSHQRARGWSPLEQRASPRSTCYGVLRCRSVGFSVPGAPVEANQADDSDRGVCLCRFGRRDGTCHAPCRGDAVSSGGRRGTQLDPDAHRAQKSCGMARGQPNQDGDAHLLRRCRRIQTARRSLLDLPLQSIWRARHAPPFNPDWRDACRASKAIGSYLRQQRTGICVRMPIRVSTAFPWTDSTLTGGRNRGPYDPGQPARRRVRLFELRRLFDLEMGGLSDFQGSAKEFL